MKNRRRVDGVVLGLRFDFVETILIKKHAFEKFKNNLNLHIKHFEKCDEETQDQRINLRRIFNLQIQIETDVILVSRN